MKSLLHAGRLAGRGLMYAERALLVLMLSGMIALAFTQIVLRNFFSTSLLWADPLLRHLVLWTGFFGAALGVEHGRHIKLDLISRFTSHRVASLVGGVVSVFASVVCGFLTNAAWTFLLSEKESGDELFNAAGTSYPVWWFQIIIPAGFALLAIHFFLKSAEYFFDPKPEKPIVPDLPIATTEK